MDNFEFKINLDRFRRTLSLVNASSAHAGNYSCEVKYKKVNLRAEAQISISGKLGFIRRMKISLTVR